MIVLQLGNEFGTDNGKFGSGIKVLAMKGLTSMKQKTQNHSSSQGKQHNNQSILRSKILGSYLKKTYIKI